MVLSIIPIKTWYNSIVIINKIKNQKLTFIYSNKSFLSVYLTYNINQKILRYLFR